MEGFNTAVQERPEDAARKEMIAALERTLSDEDFALYQEIIGSRTGEGLEEKVAAFNAQKAGTPDEAESLEERQGSVEITLVGGRTLRIDRSKRGTFTLSLPGAL